MSKRFPIAGCFMAVMAVALSGQGVPSQGPGERDVPPIIADVKSTLTTGGTAGHAIDSTRNGHYFRSRDGKVREDTAVGSVITDSKARTITFLNHAKKEATVISMSDSDLAELKASRDAAHNNNKNDKTQVTSLGDDTVEGHPIHKKRIESTDKTSHHGQKTEIWTATDIHMPVFVKATGSDRTTTREYRNIQVTDPDPQVFAIPKDYRIVDKSQFTPPLISHH
jgi:hypothetical protein